MTLRNTSTETLRFQLSVYAWGQSPQGEMLLSPTGDIVFFPHLLTLAPGEERKVRVGATTPPGSTEKTYRIVTEELPPRQQPLESSPGAQVRILTRMSIPIFLQPAKTLVEGRIEAMAVRHGRLSFQIKNSGTVHFLVQTIRVTGHGAAGEPALNRDLQGWYILAGGTRIYELDLPREECNKLRALTLEVHTAQKPLTERLEILPSACGQ